MTKSDLIKRVARRNQDFVEKDVEAAVRTIIDEMCSSLTKGQRVEVRGFGAFVLNYRPPHERMLQVQFVHLAHQRQIGRAVGFTTPPTARVTIGLTAH